MTQPKPFLPVKLVCGIMAGQDRFFDLALERLGRAFGPIDVQSPRHDFALTDYYRSEMGSGLKRMFASFERLVRPESLSETKLQTNDLEEEIRREWPGPSRLVNLDPGYVTSAALIMATTKDFSHRIPLQRGIYAHLEFLFEKKGTRFLPWTYPDFRDGRYNDFFLKVRKAYAAQLGPKAARKNQGRGPA
jgi:hypothetical protein